MTRKFLNHVFQIFLNSSIKKIEIECIKYPQDIPVFSEKILSM